MRPIKFRAWDKENKEMSQVKALDWQTNSRDKRVEKGSVSQVLTTDAVSVFDSHYSKPIWEMELMQFTGLLDKNEKEIYEGDILANGKDASIYNGRIGVVEYVTNNSVDHPINGYWAALHDEAFTIYPKSVEVIGNIYENPELLKAVEEKE